MKFETKFSLNQKVILCALEMCVIIRAVWVDGAGISYKITYWTNGERREHWVFEDELQVGDE